MLEPSYRHLRTDTDRGVLVLTIAEPLLLDDALVDALRRDLLAAVAYHQPKKVVLDFQHVRAVSSAAFRPVISLHRRVQEADGQLILCHLCGMAEEVFRITGLISDDPADCPPLATEPDRPAAVARLKRADAKK
jgi:anti-anti-sigma factor